MTYARIENGVIAEYPIYEGDIKLRFPNTSFPIPFTPPDNYEAVTDVTAPQIDHTQVISESTPEYINGILTRVWRIEEASSELIAERAEAKANTLRADRNRRLSESDWTQLHDSPVNHGEWAIYRQELRDLPNQSGFPWQVTWPTKPS